MGKQNLISVMEIFMSLNKYDLDNYRRAKRHRALKIDLLIIALFALAAIFIIADHPVPGRASPAFHKSQTTGPAPARTGTEMMARAQN